MIAVPFVFFTILLFIQYAKNKRQFDIACFIYAIYAVISFFSIAVDKFDMRSYETRHYEISFFASFLYCGLLYACIYPIAKYSHIGITSVRPLEKTSLLKLLAVGGLFYFFYYFVSSLPRIQTVLHGDIAMLRSDIRFMSDVSSSLIDKMLSSVFSCPWIFLLLGFYSWLVQKLEMKYVYMFFLGSLTSILMSVVGVDRSGVAYWIIGVCACSILFRPWMNPKQYKRFKKGFLLLLILLFAYLALITLGRFAQGNSSSVSDSLITYFGQSYVNFCYFVDNFECPTPTLTCVFPMLTKLFGTELDIVELQYSISEQSGIFIGVFYTFLGHIYVTSNITVMVLYVICFFIFSMLSLRRKKQVSLFYLFIYFLFSSVLFFGLFTHFYAISTRTFSVFLLGSLIYKMSKKNRKSL